MYLQKTEIEVEIYLYALQAACNDQCPQVRRHGIKALKITPEFLELCARSPVFSEVFDVSHLLLDISFRSALVDLGQNDAGTVFLAFSNHFDSGMRVSYSAIFAIDG